jgi:hypothetical protein
MMDAAMGETMAEAMVEAMAEVTTGTMTAAVGGRQKSHQGGMSFISMTG